jgi:hypothetical protein
MGVEPRGLHYFYKANISQSNEGHVAPKHWATCPLLIRCQYDTCQHSTRPRQPMKMCQRTTNRYAPRHHDGTALHVAVRTVRTGTVSIPNFSCLAWRTDRDISSIRTPFAKVNIPPESGRRDGRNGTVFVSFRAL